MARCAWCIFVWILWERNWYVSRPCAFGVSYEYRYTYTYLEPYTRCMLQSARCAIFCARFCTCVCVHFASIRLFSLGCGFSITWVLHNTHMAKHTAIVPPCVYAVARAKPKAARRNAHMWNANWFGNTSRVFNFHWMSLLLSFTSAFGIALRVLFTLVCRIAVGWIAGRFQTKIISLVAHTRIVDNNRIWQCEREFASLLNFCLHTNVFIQTDGRTTKKNRWHHVCAVLFYG